MTEGDVLRWDPPGKGDWRGLHDHFPRPATPEYQHLLSKGMSEGERISFDRYGLPMATLQPGFVHGRVFVTAAPLVGPAADRMPPAPLLWLFVRLVPAFRRRAAAARRALVERPWLEEARHWYEVERPRWIERNTALEAIDPGTLDDSALAAHVRAARRNAEDGYRDHFRLHGPDLIPTAMLVARGLDFGIGAAESVSLLAGSSPASRGDTPLPAWALATGYDVVDRCACELNTRPAATTPPRPVPAPPDDALAGRVPPEHRSEWEQLLADARATYGVRDDNGIYTAAWPVGLLRRAMLEAGRRLAARGRLHDPEHGLELSADELATVLEGGAGPSADEARDRLAERIRIAAHPAPNALGPALNVPMSVLPPAMRKVSVALLTLRDHGMMTPTGLAPMHGVGIGTASVVGRACVVDDPVEAIERFEAGDILVTAGTSPSWNAVLAVAGGVVTEEGGPMSHAAVIARELGLPAVIGAPDVMRTIDDGATIEVDPVAGVVRVLASTP